MPPRRRQRRRARRVKPLTVAKIALAVTGVGLFAFGIRLDNAAIRWAGTGLVAVAWLLRFVKDTASGE